MTIETKTAIYNDMSGFSEMRRIAREDPEAALRQVAEQFEGIFMQMMLKSMRDASMGNSLFGSEQSQMYQEMFDNQLSLSLSKGNSNGLADILVKQLSGLISHDNKEQNNTELMPPDKITGSTKQERFINTVRPYAEKAAKELGTSAEVLIAQAALETGWGEGIQRHSNGRSGFNLFNIKAHSNWQGPIVSKNTVEYKNGIATREYSNFKAYTSMDESFKDYVNFLKSNPRYEHALSVSNEPMAYIKALAKSGYATDPAYASKVINLLSQDVSPHFDTTKKDSK